MSILLARVARRVPVQVRRDAAQTLSNGRVLYDALFSRIGLQSYPGSIEYRPPEEVFSPQSLASLAHLPGVLLHPEDNFGTKFGSGSYPVRGCTGDRAVQHTDNIHTAGQLCVWDDEWNGLIERDEVGEISIGFTIMPDETPGEAPEDMPGVAELGRRYQVIHREIIGDHCAGVPAGNAGTARVVKDAAGARATRHALAEIAAARMDARPLYHDLGQWPARTRKDSDMNPNAIKALIKQLRADKAQRSDGLADLLEKVLMLAVDNPDMSTDLKAIAGEIKALIEPAAEEPAPVPESPAADEDPEDPDAPPAEPAMKADAVRKLVADAVTAERARVLDAADERADALEVARHVFGRDYAPRHDGKPISTAAIKRAVVGKADVARLAKLDKLFPAGPRRDAAIEAEFERVREQINDAATRSYGDQLLEQISAARADAAEHNAEVDGALKELSARLDAHDKAAAQGRPAKAS